MENQGVHFTQFISQHRERAISFLNSRFQDLGAEELEDVFQESSIALFQNIKSGKVADLTSSLYSYFLRICINQTLKALTRKEKHVTVSINETEVQQRDMISMTRVEQALKACSDEEADSVAERKSKLVRSILEVMSPQCKMLLWSFYAEDLSWSVIAASAGLANANSAKSTANRCRHAFKEKYNALKSKIYG